MGYTPGTMSAATLHSIIDPNGNTLYTDLDCTLLATTAGVVKGNKDAFSSNTATMTSASNTFATKLNIAGNGFKSLQTTANANATQGAGMKFNSGAVDPSQFIFFIAMSPARAFLGADDLIADIGNSVGGTTGTMQIVHDSGWLRPYNGSTFGTTNSPYLSPGHGYYVFVCVSSQTANYLFLRGYEQRLVQSRSATTQPSATGWQVAGRNAGGQWGSLLVGLAELYTGTLTEAEIASEVTAIYAYLGSVGAPLAYTAGASLILADGDSNTVGIGTTAISATWPDLLGQRVAATAAAAVTLGVQSVAAASRLATTLGGYSASTINRLNAVSGVAMYLLSVGENDLQAVTGSTLITNLATHLSSIRTGAPQAKIGYLTPPPRGDANGGYENNRQGFLTLFNADPTLGSLIDFVVPVGSDSGMGSASTTASLNYYSDKIHYSAVGQARIVDTLDTAPLAQVAVPYFLCSSLSASFTALTVTGGQQVSLASTAYPTATAPKNAVWTGHSSLTAITSLGTTAIALNQATFIAPAAALTAQTFLLTAASVVQPTASALFTITLAAGVVNSVTLAPTAVTLAPLAVQTFTATVSVASGATTGIGAWSIAPSLGSIDAGGNYTAPAQTTVSQVVLITAASLFDPSVKGYATATVTASATAAPAGDGRFFANNIGLSRRQRSLPGDEGDEGSSGMAPTFIPLSAPGLMGKGPNTAPKLGTRNKPK